MPFGLDELAGAVRPEGDPGHTVQEIAAASGEPRRTVSRRILRLVASGKCLKGWGYREGQAGRRYHVPVYRMAKG